MSLKKSLVPALVLTGLTLLVATAVHAAVTENFKQTYPLNADGEIRVDNVNGSIEIVAWDKPEVALEAEKRAKNEEDLQRVHLKIDATATRFTVKTEYEKKSGWFGGNVDASVHYKLMVPAGARLDKIDSVNSDITVTGVRGSVNLDTVNGRITATGLAADARLDTTNGSLSAEFASLDQVHTVKLDSTNGSAEVILPKGASARIRTSTVNGHCRVEQPIKLSRTGRDLAGEIGSGGPEISLDTVNGGIAVREK